MHIISGMYFTKRNNKSEVSYRRFAINNISLKREYEFANRYKFINLL